MIGAIAGCLVPLGVDLLERLRIDDPIGAVAVHGFVGIWGTLAVGLFATGQFGVPGPEGADNSVTVRGLFYGGGTSQLVVQMVGSASAVVVVSVVSFALFKFVRSLPGTWNLRLEKELELEGIDYAEHGNRAYHMEFGHGMTYTTPAGMTSDRALVGVGGPPDGDGDTPDEVSEPAGTPS
jgi:Amt family ammonium transporter